MGRSHRKTRTGSSRDSIRATSVCLVRSDLVSAVPMADMASGRDLNRLLSKRRRLNPLSLRSRVPHRVKSNRLSYNKTGETRSRLFHIISGILPLVSSITLLFIHSCRLKFIFQVKKFMRHSVINAVPGWHRFPNDHPHRQEEHRTVCSYRCLISLASPGQ